MSKRKRRRRRRIRIILISSIILLVLVITILVVRQVGMRVQRDLALRYPMSYEALIRSNAGAFGLEPAYVAGVVLAESSFDPEAVSSADARGLMQLLPSTAGWIAEKLGEEFSEERLFDPETNLRYGCWYLQFLMNRYSDIKKNASAAYHAGQGTVDKWLGNPEYSADGITLDVIPYASTDAYVQRVLDNYEKYSELYANED